MPLPNSALIVLDKYARIRFCSLAAERIFGHRAHEVLGTEVTALIPGLPLRNNTPGYNLAYATFQRGNGLSHCFLGRHASGGEFALDVALATTRLQGKHGLVVALRIARNGGSTGHGGIRNSKHHVTSPPPESRLG
ncbi:PAS domain S-box protein [Pseudothauera lacus]|uniref:PAS domain S-box protein n=1 Tax=Pseudothauera lacus TaxID=2136175 RepID=UPI0015E78C25|nr:PAS domain S-box protein [Pseudothauera lacus]